VVLVTNGLEGTVQELLVPLLRYRDSGLATFVMEMPGSYAYERPMRVSSERVYRAVVDALVSSSEVDGSRIGVVGVSFGGYWSARLAVVERRLTCAVACGAPTHRTFLPANALGLPQVILEALKAVTGSRTLLTMSHRLRALSLRRRYADADVPLLVVNGDHDTLLSTQDSVDLAREAPDATLLLYPGDDHCAMGHYREWLDASQRFLGEHLLGQGEASSAT
jgi:esterase FrsA